MARLLSLSRELIYIILGFSGLQALSALTRTCKALRALAEPVLYLRDRESRSPKLLLWAVKTQRAATITKALQDGYDIDFADSQELTALHHATRHNGDELVRFLLQNGAGVDPDSTWHGTPLDYACENGHFRSAIALVEAGACADPSALCSCVRSIHVNEPVSDTMKELECLQEQLSRKLVTSLSRSGDFSRCHGGSTPLLCAVLRDNLPAIQLLLGLGVDANTPDYEGITPLMAAVSALDLGYVKVFLAAGAEPNRRSQRGKSALDFLEPNIGNKETMGILQQLLEHGADIPGCAEGVSHVLSSRAHESF